VLCIRLATFYKCNLAQTPWIANYRSTASVLTVVGDAYSGGSELAKPGASGMGLSPYHVQQQLAP
jgi:hypothetical protein